DRLGARVLLQVEEAVRKAVASEEHTQPPRVGREARSDHARARAEPDQQRPSGQVCAQYDVRQARVTLDELEKLPARNLQHLAGLDNARGQVDGFAGEEIQL